MDKITIDSLQCKTSKSKKESNCKWIIGRSILFLMASFSALLLHAQDLPVKKEAADMATGMRSNGKIYVVVAVLCMILLGLFIYLISLDKKVGKLEKEINK